MKTKTIMTPDFMGRTAKIIAEMRARICMDYVDTEVLKEILQDELKELNEYCRMLDEYYDEKYYSTIDAARSSAYNSGHSDGYARGYDVGYEDGHSESH